MTNNELRNYFYDTAREYLDEHCPDLEDYDHDETPKHDAHVALIDLLVEAFIEGREAGVR